MSDYTLFGKRISSIGFFGFGSSNREVWRYLSKRFHSLKFTLRSDDKVDSNTYFCRSFFGKEAYNNIDEDILFLSPSVRRDRKELKEAEERGVILSSDVELFFDKTDRHIVGVTGSCGKSTTAELIARILTASGIPAEPGGNFGKGLCSFLDTGVTPVAELSSFQLMYSKPRLSTAVITNITPNHLNWHKDFSEYAAAKMNITAEAEKIIYDADSDEMLGRLSGRRAFAIASQTFSYDELKSLNIAEHYITVTDDHIMIDNVAQVSLFGAKRKERHNIKNYMLAVGATFGIADGDTIQSVIESFEGLAHRCETVCVSGGIRYIDSSIDSSPDRTIATLKEIDGDKIVIICGMNKGLPLAPLFEALPSISAGAVFMGEIGKELFASFREKEANYKCAFANDMHEAVNMAKELAMPSGGSVVLSPGGTSFDMYKNYIERGQVFRSAALKQ